MNYYKKQGRHDLPWRPQPKRSKNLLRSTKTTRGLPLRKDGTLPPYNVLVSEIMLQQTQVDRVIPKYKAFIKEFPSFASLAQAPLRKVLSQWHGLGYNRRCLNLKRTAEIITRDYNGRFPKTYDELVALPGIGPYTAGALLAFAFNTPSIFIETNIRTVYIHHFEKQLLRMSASSQRTSAREGISDHTILELMTQHLNTTPHLTRNPRDWYYALMDYGTHLKKTIGNKNTKSSHYTKQSRFKGSHRELRAQILRAITEKPCTSKALAKLTKKTQKTVRKALTELENEGFIEKKRTTYTIK